MQATSKDAGRRQKVQSAEYGLTVLKALGHGGGSMSLTSLAQAVDASPAKVHRYLASLKQAGFVYQDEVTSRYVLGQEAIMLGIAAMRQADVLHLSAPALVKLSEEHNVSCFVAVLGNSGPTIMRWEEPLAAVTVNVRPGSTLPILWSATGRAFGAFARSKFIDDAIRREVRSASPENRQELPDLAAVKRKFEQIRNDGCAFVRDVLLSGVSAVAAPVFDSRRKVCAVLTALGTSGQIDPSPDSKLARSVMKEAERISLSLGAAAAA